MVNNKLLIMTLGSKYESSECIGYVERKPDGFIQCLNGEITEHSSLPRIMQDIAPEPTQFPAANLVLDYYKMSRIDVWEYFQKSNGFKSCRDVWFMSEPIGEVWVPLGFGAKRFRDWGMICRIGDKFKVQMNGFINVNRHSFPVFPYCIAPYLRKDEHSRFSTDTGFIYDLGDYPAVHGLMGRAIIDFGTP